MFPLPVEVLLIPLIVVDPDLLFPLIGGALLGSLLGGTLSFLQGRRDSIWARERLKGVMGVVPGMILKADRWLGRYREEAIALFCWTGVPYKVFATLSGAARHPLFSFLCVSVLARSLRFLIAGWAARVTALHWMELIQLHAGWMALGYTGLITTAYGFNQWLYRSISGQGVSS